LQATGEIQLKLLVWGAEKLTSLITGVEMFLQTLIEGSRDNVGLLLRGVDKADIKEVWLLLQVQ
jgi:translation elongation factor EF-Tu-like GTPase